MPVRHWVVTGIVQGVGFRYFTQSAATKLGVSGFVRNLSDGSVDVWASGGGEALERLRRELERGPVGSEVGGVRDAVVSSEGEEALNSDAFVIRG